MVQSRDALFCSHRHFSVRPSVRPSVHLSVSPSIYVQSIFIPSYFSPSPSLSPNPGTLLVGRLSLNVSKAPLNKTHDNPGRRSRLSPPSACSVFVHAAS